MLLLRTQHDLENALLTTDKLLIQLSFFPGSQLSLFASIILIFGGVLMLNLIDICLLLHHDLLLVLPQEHAAFSFNYLSYLLNNEHFCLFFVLVCQIHLVLLVLD